jgi:Kef-type K+ transport system membrane component KefB
MELFIVILVILVAARLAGELVERVGQPSILGELLAGVGLGFLVVSFPGYFPRFVGLAQDEAFKAITDLGIFFLMFLAGMEVRLEQLLRASKRGALVAVGGVIVPFGLGYAIGNIYLPDSDYKFAQAIFLGVALSITALAVSARVLMDLGQINTRMGHTIISAAIIDDIIGLGLLAVITSLLDLGRMPSGGELAILGIKIFGFFLFAIILGRFIMPHLAKGLRGIKAKEMEFSIGLALALILGVIAEWLGMHFIIGAFIAGLLVQEKTFGAKAVEDIRDRVSGITLGFLAPLFFASIGLHLDLSALTASLSFALALLLAAMLGKIIGCGLPAKLMKFSNKESLAVGIGMNGRGAVELVVVAVALEAGLFTQPIPTPPIVSSIFSSVVFMAIVTTLMTPILLKLLLKPR